MPIPQAPRWEDPEEVKDILKRFRNAQPDKEKHTDYELAQRLGRQSKYKGINKSSYVEDSVYAEHLSKKNPRLYGLLYEKSENKTPRWDLDEPTAIKTQTGWGTFMGLGGAIDMGPKWLSNAIKTGANESITGLAVAIGSGDTPFDIDDDYDPNMVESAMGFGFGMVYDSWFFALTKGLGVGPALAGSTARKAAAQGIAKQFFAKNMTAELGQSAVKGMGKKASKKFVKGAIAKERTADGAKRALLNKAKEKGVGINKEVVDTIFENSVASAENSVASMIARPEFLAKGLTKIGNYELGAKSINAPSLTKMFGHFGGKAATGLGLYEASAETGREMRDYIAKQVNPETGQEYGYGEGESFVKRWEDGTLSDAFPVHALEFDKIAWRFAHGFSGGFMAGGLGGIMKAGRMGAFTGKKVNDALVSKVGDWTYGKAADMTLEATGFTGVGSLLNYMETGSVDAGAEHGLAGNFVHNLVTIGVLKGMRRVQEGTKEKADAHLTMLQRKMNEAHVTRKKAHDRVIESQKGESSEASKVIRKEAQANKNKLEDVFEADIQGLKDRLKAIKDVLTGSGLSSQDLQKGNVKFKKGYKIIDGERVPNMTGEQATVLVELVRDFQAFKDKAVKEYGVSSKSLDKTAKEMELFDFFEQDVAGGTGKVFAELERQLSKADNIRAKKEQELVVEKGVEIDKAPETVEKLDIELTKKLDKINDIQRITGNDKVLNAEGKLIPIKKATPEELESAHRSAKKQRDEILEDKGLKKVDTKQKKDVTKYDDTPKERWKSLFGKEGEKASKLIENTPDGPLKDLLKSVVVSHQGTPSTLYGKTNMARQFYAELTKKGMSIKNATEKDMTDFLNSKYANTNLQGATKSYARYVMAAITGKSPGDIKIKHKGTDAKRDPMLPETYQENQKSLEQTLRKNKEVKLGNKSISRSTARAINYIIAKIGSRQDFIFGGKQDHNNALKVSDVKEGAPLGKTKTLEVTFSGKTSKGTKWMIPDLPQGAEKVNYYKVFKELTQGKKGNERLIKSTDNVALTKLKFKEFANEYLLNIVQKPVEGRTVHTMRHTIMGIAKRLETSNAQVPDFAKKYGKTWTDIADVIFLTHTPTQSGRTKDIYLKWFTNQESGSRSLMERMMLQSSFWQQVGKLKPQKRLDAAEILKLEKQLKSIEGVSKKQIVKESYPGEADNPNRQKIEYTIETKTGEVLSEQILAFEGSGKGGERTIIDAYRTVLAEQRTKVSREVNILRDMQLVEMKAMQKSAEGMSRYEIAKRRLEVLKKQEKQALKKSMTESTHPLHEKALKRVVTLLASRNKGMKVLIEKNGKNAGEIVGDLIKVTQGKADATTFFHENVHRLEAFVKATGDKQLMSIWKKGESSVIDYAKKNHKNLFELYEKGYKPNELANELMTQLSAESSLRQFNRSSTWLGKSQNWVNNFVSKLKLKLGLGSVKDIARVYGRIAEKGFSTEGYRLNINQIKYQKIESGPPSVEARIEYGKVHREKGLNRGLVRILMESTPGLESLIGKIQKNGMVEGLSGREQQLLTDSIKRLDDTTFKLKRDKDHQDLLNATGILRTSFGITKKLSYEIGKTLGVPGSGSLRFASKIQLQRMQEMYKQFGKKYEPSTAVLDEAMMDVVSGMSNEFGQIRKSINAMTMPVGYVLRKMGMKKVAEKVEDHYYEEQRLVGIGHEAVYDAKALVGGKGLDYLGYAIDKTLLEPTVVDGKTINIKADPKRDAFIENSKKPGTKEYEAKKKIEDMYKEYWDEFMKIGREKIPNPAEFEVFKEKYNPRYVKDYFTRVLTKDAQKHLNLGTNYETQISSFVKQNQKIMLEDINKKYEKVKEEVETFGESTQRRIAGENQLKKMEATRKSLAKDITNPNSKTYQKLLTEAERQLSSLIARSSTKVKNNNLMSRQPKLDNSMLSAEGKIIQTYETSFETVFNKYQRNMSNFLSTAKHFTEYTSIKGESTFSTQGEILKQMGKDSDLGAYLEKVIKRRIGLESKSQTGKEFTDVLTSMGKYSAMFGLSSPFSGVKNLTIGTQMTLGVHGVRAFAYGLRKAFQPQSWREARRKGWLQIGTKEIEIGGWEQRISESLGHMQKTEAVNRIIGGFAGEFSAREMVQRLHKNTGLYASKGDAKIGKEMGDMFNLKPSEVAFLKRYGLDADTNVWADYGIKGKRKKLYLEEQANILSKIQHYGHIKSQGAAGDPFLPLWAGNANAKALTLFYRMAYSGTANIFNHIITPAKNGNLLPLARYTLASNLAGGALWEMYEKVLGTSPPKINEGILNQVGQNFAKSEALGLASFLMNPYSNGFKLSEAITADSIMQPAIIRNSYNVAQFGMRLLNADKSNMVDATRKLVSKTLVVAGHGFKAYSKVTTPFKTDAKNLRTFRSAYEQKSGLWDEYNKGNPFSAKYNENAEYYNLIKNAFSGRESDMAAASRFYVATWYYLYDNYRVFNGYEQYNHKASMKKADSALNNVVKKINPLYQDTNPKTGKMFNNRDKFLQYLNPVERKKALVLEKQYYRKLRQLNSLLKKEWQKQGGYYKRGEIQKMFPLPGSSVNPTYKSADIKKIVPDI